jgi:hypothetical protein
MKHTPETFAALLHGREYSRDEITKEEERLAKESGLVIAIGASDDLCEIYGAIRDEGGCYDGGKLAFTTRGFTCWEDGERDTLEKFGVLEQVLGKMGKIEAVWGGKTADGRECSWHYKANFPHATFDIMEDGELYCQGIVFRLEDALGATTLFREAGRA